MKIEKLIVAVAVFAATASAYAQQTEFVAPDAGFKPGVTRAEVRQDMASAAREGVTAQHQHDGQDAVHAAGSQSRQDVRAEAIKSARSHRGGNVNDLYFGA